MLKLHKENVNEITIKNKDGTIITGREVFRYFLCELHVFSIIYKEFQNKNSNYERDKNLEESYRIFFNGDTFKEYLYELNSDASKEYIKAGFDYYYVFQKLKESREGIYSSLELLINKYTNKYLFLDFELFMEHYSQIRTLL
jgi:hypothetical protein